MANAFISQANTQAMRIRPGIQDRIAHVFTKNLLPPRDSNPGPLFRGGCYVHCASPFARSQSYDFGIYNYGVFQST
jgi:hypothetical protein